MKRDEIERLIRVPIREMLVRLIHSILIQEIKPAEERNGKFWWDFSWQRRDIVRGVYIHRRWDALAFVGDRGHLDIVNRNDGKRLRYPTLKKLYDETLEWRNS